MFVFFSCPAHPRVLHSFPTRRSSDLSSSTAGSPCCTRTSTPSRATTTTTASCVATTSSRRSPRSEEHTSELQSRQYLVCRLLLEKKNNVWNRRDLLRAYNFVNDSLVT